MVQTRKAWDAPCDSRPRREGARTRCADPARHRYPGDRYRRRGLGRRLAPAADAAPHAPCWRRPALPEKMRTCNASVKFFTRRGERAGARWLPRHGYPPAHHSCPGPTSPGLSTAGSHTPGEWPCVAARTVIELIRGLTALRGLNRLLSHEINDTKMAQRPLSMSLNLCYGKESRR